MAREGRRSAEEVIYENNRKYTTLIDYVGGTNPIYVGKAQAGTATSDPFWQIFKITWDGSNNPTHIQWADAVTTFTKVWDNRATGGYVYS
jgi:hypothetical protein